jgi:hypothetical protein
MAKQNKQEKGFLNCRELHHMFCLLQNCILQFLHIQVIAFIFPVKLTYHLYLRNEALPQSFDTVMLPKRVRNLIKINLNVFEFILYFYCGYFLSSWNRIVILDLNWILVFEIPVLVAYTTLRLYCTDVDTSKRM